MVLVLAQTSPFSVPTPPPLPSPPFLESLFLEHPLPLAIGLLAAGLIGARALWRRPGASRWGWLAVALLLTAGPGLVLLAALVTTDREQMRSAVAELVRSIAKADSAGMDRLLAPDCILISHYGFPGYQGGTRGMDKDAILAQVPATIRDYPIAKHAIEECQAQSRGRDIGTTQLLVRVVVEFQGAGYRIPVRSWWRVDWRRQSDRWQAVSIEALTDPAGPGSPR